MNLTSPILSNSSSHISAPAKQNLWFFLLPFLLFPIIAINDRDESLAELHEKFVPHFASEQSTCFSEKTQYRPQSDGSRLQLATSHRSTTPLLKMPHEQVEATTANPLVWRPMRACREGKMRQNKAKGNRRGKKLGEIMTSQASSRVALQQAATPKQRAPFPDWLVNRQVNRLQGLPLARSPFPSLFLGSPNCTLASTRPKLAGVHQNPQLKMLIGGAGRSFDQ